MNVHEEWVNRGSNNGMREYTRARDRNKKRRDEEEEDAKYRTENENSHFVIRKKW